MIVLKINQREFESLIASNGYTQSELARQLEVSRNVLTLLKKRDRGSMGEIKAIKLCNMLNVEFDDLFKKVKHAKT